MLRRVVLVILAVIPLLGCSRPAPPKTVESATERPQPKQELVPYLEQDKNVRGFLCRPGGEGPYPAVVLIHDRMGLNEAMKDAAFRLARQDYVVLAVDLYRGRVPKDAKDAERLERELPKERVLGDLKSAVDYLCHRDEVRGEQVVEVKTNKQSHVLGAVGLGMGGSYALEAALRDSRLRALVLCYCRLPTEAKQLATLEASVFGIFAEKDQNVPLQRITQFSKAMETAGKRLYAVRVYGESPHGFLDPANWPMYGKPPEKDVMEAWFLIARFLDRILM